MIIGAEIEAGTPAMITLEQLGNVATIEAGEYDGEIVPMATPTPQVLEDLTGFVQGAIAPAASVTLAFGSTSPNQQLIVMSLVMSAQVVTGSNREEFQLIAIDQLGAQRVAHRWYIPQSVLFNLQAAVGPIRLRAGERGRLQSMATGAGAAALWAFNLSFGYL